MKFKISGDYWVSDRVYIAMPVIQIRAKIPDYKSDMMLSIKAGNVAVSERTRSITSAVLSVNLLKV